MTPDDLLLWRCRQPFEPFRIWVSDGNSYEIRHPELCMPGFTSTVIGLPRDPERPVAERFEMISMPDIVKVEALDATVTRRTVLVTPVTPSSIPQRLAACGQRSGCGGFPVWSTP